MKKRTGIRFGMGFAALLLLSGCGGLNICDCEKESGKENPDAELMEKCRKMFAEMEMDEVMKAIEECDVKE